MHTACQPRTTSQTLDLTSSPADTASAAVAELGSVGAAADSHTLVQTTSSCDAGSAAISSDSDSQPGTSAETAACHASTTPLSDAAATAAAAATCGSYSTVNTGLLNASNAASCRSDDATAAEHQQAQTGVLHSRTSDECNDTSAEATSRLQPGSIMAGAAGIAASVAGCISGALSSTPLARMLDTDTNGPASTDDSFPAADDAQDMSVTSGSDGADEASGSHRKQLGDAEQDPAGNSPGPQSTVAGSQSTAAARSTPDASDCAPGSAADVNSNTSIGHNLLPQHATATISRLQRAAATAAAQHSNSAAAGQSTASNTRLGNAGGSHPSEPGVSHGHADQHRKHEAGHAVPAESGYKSAQGRAVSNADKLQQDRLLVAANAALLSLLDNADTHFVAVNEGAAPALVATLQHGKPPYAHPQIQWFQFWDLFLSTLSWLH